MELLIIVVIMMVLSSLSRYLRKKAQKAASFDPRPYVAPSRSSRKDVPSDKRLDKNLAKREWQESQPSWRPEPGQTPYAREGPGGEKYAASIRHETGRPAAAGSRSGEIKKPQAFQEPSQAPARARPAAGKNNGAAGKETATMEKQLRDLIKNEGLPLGIVISDILGPPRGKNPYRIRKM